MKTDTFQKTSIAILAAIIGFNLKIRGQVWVPSYLIDDYSEAGRPLPPGVPRTVETNGKVVYIPETFTTKLYQAAAFQLVLQEANQVAKDMQLPEELPVTETNVTGAYIGSFGYNYSVRSIGDVTTKNYYYGVLRGDKFSHIIVANYEQTCMKLQDGNKLPIAQMDTNAAYQLAIKWLAAAHMDVKGLNRDCKAHIALSPRENGVMNLGDVPEKEFVPMYYLWWTSPENDAHGDDSAYVELYLPTKSLLQFVVNDPKYILRRPLVFTNLAALFPGVAPIHTNYPVKTIYLSAPASHPATLPNASTEK